ncbi:MAG: tocopherol cyclase family protein, partial [Planctomycetota bacterium]
GREHARRYAWLQCNAFEAAEGTVLEAISARVGLGPFALPYLTVLVLHHDGVTYDLSAPRHWLNRKAKVSAESYSLEARSKDARIRIECEALASQTVELTYKDPSGYATTCRNTKLAALRVEVTPAGGAQPIALRSKQAALETLGF